MGWEVVVGEPAQLGSDYCSCAPHDTEECTCSGQVSALELLSDDYQRDGVDPAQARAARRLPVLFTFYGIKSVGRIAAP